MLWAASGTRRRALTKIWIQLALTWGAAIALSFVGLKSPVVCFFVVAALAYLPIVADRVRVTVGADGLRVRPVLGRARFVPFASLDTTSVGDGTLALHLRDGATVTLRAIRDARALAHIEEQVALHGGRELDPGPLARAGRTTRAWISDLRAVSEGSASFRSLAIPRDSLWNAVEDAAAPPSARAAAAVALRDALSDDERARLRAVARTCAAPHLRVALEHCASPTPTAPIAAALDRLDPH